MSETVVVMQPSNQIVVEGSQGIPGPTGPAGAQGIQGVQGPSGGPWKTGTGSPNGVVTGSLNDMYLDTSNGDVYQCTTAGTTWTLRGNIKGATGTAGSAGAAGTRGSLWTSGTVVPTAANNSGDMYLRTTTDDVYQGAGGTTWNLVANLKGSQGIQGIQGVPGTNGADGNPNIFYNALTAPAGFTTTLTTMLSLVIPSTGTYLFEAFVKWNAGDTVQGSFRFDYSGTTGAASVFDAVRIAGSTAHMEGLTFNTLTGTSAANPQVLIVSGILVANTTGTLTLKASRAASGTSTMPAGVYMRASK
jgi:hypothetical protein